MKPLLSVWDHHAVRHGDRGASGCVSRNSALQDILKWQTFADQVRKDQDCQENASFSVRYVEH